MITSFGETHVGLKRKRNEDSYVCSAEQGLWLIADGMGGHPAGDVASSIVVNQVAAAHAKGIPIADTLSIASQALADAVKVGQGAEEMGTTVVVLVLIDNQYEITWVGDSRAYIWSGKSLVQISRDHSLVQRLVDQGTITEEEAFFHPQGNVLERALGPSMKETMADQVSNSLAPGDRLLLCSDGLSSQVPHKEIEKVFAQGLDDRNTIQELINLALVYGGHDNITAIVVSNSHNPTPGKEKTMSDKTHLAVEANKLSIKYAMERNKEAWLALYTDDAVVCDPVGVSPMDPSGEGHHGKKAIEAFWDNVIGKANIEIRVDKRWTSGDYCCCVAQVARNAVGDGNFTECDMLAVYHVNAEGLITSMKAHWSFDDMMEQVGKHGTA